MDEQDHANPNSKLIAAIFRTAQFYSAEDAEKLAGDLSEFVRGIVREEVRAANTDTFEWIGKIAAGGAYQPRCICLADWKERATVGCVVPISSTCAVHGMK